MCVLELVERSLEQRVLHDRVRLRERGRDLRLQRLELVLQRVRPSAGSSRGTRTQGSAAIDVSSAADQLGDRRRLRRIAQHRQSTRAAALHARVERRIEIDRGRRRAPST
jgi:hypothetical protein